MISLLGEGCEVAGRKAQLAVAKLSKQLAPCSHFSESLRLPLTEANWTCQGGEQEGRRQLEEPRLMRKCKMRKSNNWKPLW